MSSCSESSVVLSDRGFPSKCVCGLGVTVFTAKTQDNPGRPFFRCESKKDPKEWTNKKDGHLFKWVEDAVYEEVEDALPKLELLVNDITSVKSEVSDAIQELRYDVKLSQLEIGKYKVWLKVCFVCICFLLIGIAYLIAGKAKETNSMLFLGY